MFLRYVPEVVSPYGKECLSDRVDPKGLLETSIFLTAIQGVAFRVQATDCFNKKPSGSKPYVLHRYVLHRYVLHRYVLHRSMGNFVSYSLSAATMEPKRRLGFTAMP